ncbi:MAG TPA: hypothetical protein VMH01_08815 [Puia sp.]|nr:hypothetical protein [Puia sp.]
MKKISILFFTNCLFLSQIIAQEKPAPSAKELADKLSNPVSSLISVPFQNNTDYGIGQYNGSKNTLNFQPVIPIKLSANLNLITRYIIPIIDQHDVVAEQSSQFGLSDATISGFFAPANSKNGFLWGVGPAFLVPIGTNEFLTAGKWGVGPTVIILVQKAQLTYGFLVNQIWSFAGSSSRPDVNQMFLQPFLAHNWPSGAGLTLNAEITANWYAQTTTAFINLTGSAVTKFGSQVISFAVGPRIPVAGPSASIADFGIRAVATFVFPK